MELTQHWLIRNDIWGCGLFWLCRTMCDLRNADTENIPLWHTVHGFSPSTKTPLFSLQINATVWWQRLKSSQNETQVRLKSQPSQSGFVRWRYARNVKMQLEINSVFWVQVQTRSLNPQPLIKEFLLRDLMTVCPHHYSYWWTSADTNCPGAEQIMACFTETKETKLKCSHSVSKVHKHVWAGQGAPAPLHRGTVQSIAVSWKKQRQNWLIRK